MLAFICTHANVAYLRQLYNKASFSDDVSKAKENRQAHKTNSNTCIRCIK